MRVVESADSGKVIGFLTEPFACRRHVEEIDEPTRGARVRGRKGRASARLEISR